MIGCLYATHAQTALQALYAAQSALVKRVRGLESERFTPCAGGSRQTEPSGCDRCPDLGSTRIEMCTGVQSRYSGWLLRDRRALHRGSGQGVFDQGESAASGPKNVTILGLLWMNGGLHIVCPKDSQRYYLLFTRTHKLFAPLFTSIPTLLKTSTLPHRHDSTKTRNSARLA
jgi:hypothetical protein